ncbi:hypothetical protein [Nocardiopsis sp. YSL2]|uniref:hypothetical protein n=1 Tax=Nocardiopsis sp. YSL2 TaxID=2939492 RepID=UPI0026F43563|nr:hypothetical protein [Nocardiopsis sp. YSL2]
MFFGTAGDEGTGPVDHTFDPWTDDEGYPLLFTVHSEPDFGDGPVPGTDITVYLGFNEDVDIEVPAESEIEPGRPSGF